MTRRIFAALSASCFLAIFAMTAPSRSGIEKAQIAWGIDHYFGAGQAAQASVGATPLGDAVKSYIEENTPQWGQIVGESGGAFMDDMLNGIGNLDPVIITAAEESITAGEAAATGAVIGAEVGTLIAPVIGTLIGGAIVAL